jgi:hypothetical protein
MGLASFSYSYASPEQNAEELVWGMKPEYKNAVLSVLMKGKLKDIAWKLLDSDREDLNDYDKQFVVNSVISDFVEGFTDESSEMYKFFEGKICDMVEDRVLEVKEGKV